VPQDEHLELAAVQPSVCVCVCVCGESRMPYLHTRAPGRQVQGQVHINTFISLSDTPWAESMLSLNKPIQSRDAVQWLTRLNQKPRHLNECTYAVIFVQHMNIPKI